LLAVEAGVDGVPKFPLLNGNLGRQWPHPEIGADGAFPRPIHETLTTWGENVTSLTLAAPVRRSELEDRLKNKAKASEPMAI
jgi:hypothetical protein